MNILYFITGHGYGHAVRSATIINHFSEHVNISIKTAVPLSFFTREIRRPFTYFEGNYDCGCLQSDSVSVDVEKTLVAYTGIDAENRIKISEEIRWCRENNISCIVSDITPFAFDVAFYCGIPSIAVTNFTWYDIYREYCQRNSSFKSVLDGIRRSYSRADLLLALSPPLPMRYFRNRKIMPVVGRTGVADRLLFEKQYGIDSSRKIALIYVGEFGLSRARWERLESCSNWEFFGLQHLKNAPSNYHEIPDSTLDYPDMIAAADCVISKLGYGVVAECMINRTPILYLPRTNFAEFPVLEDAVRKWGGGRSISSELFFTCDWREILQEMTFPELPYFTTDGAARCAGEIENLVC
jgi:hypothetical protein